MAEISPEQQLQASTYSYEPEFQWHSTSSAQVCMKTSAIIFIKKGSSEVKVMMPNDTFSLWGVMYPPHTAIILSLPHVGQSKVHFSMSTAGVN